MGGSSKTVTVGYWYGLGVHMGICYGPVDAVTEISVDDRIAWSGNQTASGQALIYQQDLFGGEEREGGLDGQVQFLFGEPSQAQSAYLQGKLGANIPAFRGILSLLWRGIVSANNPYLKPWAVTVRRILQGWYGGTAWYSAKATITNAAGNDMNPAHIVYQALTDPEWGMGYPASSIDDVNFRAVADDLYGEGFGLSLLWNQHGTIQSFIKAIMDHVGGILRVNPATGQFVIKLVRADYIAGDLPEYGPSQISDLMSYQRAAWGETVNEVTVVYTDPTTGKDTAVTVQDLANIQSQGAVVNQRLSFTGIRSNTLATRVAMRELTLRSTPLAKVKFTINRNAWALMPGDVFRLIWPKHGMSGVVMRVLSVNTGTLESGLMTVDASEDVFGLPDSSYAEQEPIGWTEPGSAPSPAPNEIAFELPYWDVSRSLMPADLDYLDPLDGYLGVIAQRPSPDAYDFILWSGTGGGYAKHGETTHCPVAMLGTSVGLTDTVLPYSGSADIDLVVTGGYIIIDGEFMRLDEIDTGALEITVSRGVLDTVPDHHTDGAVIWFADGFTGTDDQLYVDAEIVNAKVQTRTVLGTLGIGDAAELTLTMNQRQARPYPPGKVRINGAAYPSVITGPIHITWAHRDRVQQTATIIDQNEESIGPEAGTSYRVAIVGEGSDTTTGTEFSWCAPTDSTVTVTVGSTRDGLDSWQDHSITFERAGWGYNWGKYWGGASGAPDGTALVHCAPDWIYDVQMVVGGNALQQRYDLAAGAYISHQRNTAFNTYRLTWYSAAGVQSTYQPLGVRLTGNPVYDGSGHLFFGLNEQVGDTGANSPEQTHAVGKIANTGAGAPAFTDMGDMVGVVHLYDSKLWVGVGTDKIKRYTPSTMTYIDEAMIAFAAYEATHDNTRIYFRLGQSTDTTIAAYSEAMALQWNVSAPNCVGLVYADGWLWTVQYGATNKLVRISLAGIMDSYALDLPSGFYYTGGVPLDLVGGYLVVGAEYLTYIPVIVDPATGLEIARN